MDLLLSLLTLFSVLVPRMISPGPGFVMVARTSVSYSRKHGLAASIRMGIGGMIFALAALFGLKALLLAVLGLHMFLKIIGGIYLIYIGVRILRSAKEKLNDENNAGTEIKKTPFRSFWLALATQLSNPKTAVVYASVFAALFLSFLPCSAFGLFEI